MRRAALAVEIVGDLAAAGTPDTAALQTAVLPPPAASVMAGAGAVERLDRSRGRHRVGRAQVPQSQVLWRHPPVLAKARWAAESTATRCDGSFVEPRV